MPVGHVATDAALRLAACQGWTDGTQIVLPSIPTPMDDDLEKCLIGYLDHEMAHVAFSDFGVAEQFARKHPGFEGLLNVVEDALIERRATERWPLTRPSSSRADQYQGLFGRACDKPIRLRRRFR